MSESRDRLLKMAKDLNITGLVKALESKEVQQQCKDIQDFGWVLCKHGLPDVNEVYMTDGKFQYIGFYDKNLEAWFMGYLGRLARIDNIVAWTYKNDLTELQEYLKNEHKD